MVSPVSGSRRVTPAIDDEQLERDEERQPGREQLAERVAHRQRRAEPACHEQHVQHEDRAHAEQPDLLAEGGDDEVGVRQRNEFRVPAAEAGAEDAAGAEPEQRLPQLVPVVVVLVDAVGQLVEDVQPHADARLHRAEQLVRHVRADREQQDADDHPADPLGRDVEQHDEHAEEQQRRAQVVATHQHADADQPRREQRAEVATARQVEAEELLADLDADPPARQREDVALADQVRGTEDREQDLREFPGLEGESGHAGSRCARR